MTNVVTHERFGGQAVRDSLAAAGVDVSAGPSPDQIASMKLVEPQYGEKIVGELQPEEVALFYEVFSSQRQVEDQTRIIVGETLSRAGQTIRDGDRGKPMADLLKEGLAVLEFESDEQAMGYYALQQRAEMLRHTLYWMVGERLKLHHWRLGVRSRMRIVQIEKRW